MLLRPARGLSGHTSRDRERISPDISRYSVWLDRRQIARGQKASVPVVSRIAEVAGGLSRCTILAKHGEIASTLRPLLTSPLGLLRCLAPEEAVGGGEPPHPTRASVSESRSYDKGHAAKNGDERTGR